MTKKINGKLPYNPHIICRVLAVKKTSGNHAGSSYAVGLKRCTQCNEWFYQPDVRCHCCGVKLKTIARARKHKEKIIQSRKMQGPKKPYKPRPKYQLTQKDFEDAKEFINTRIIEQKAITKMHHSSYYHNNKKKCHESTKKYFRKRNLAKTFFRYCDTILNKERARIQRVKDSRRRYRAKDLIGFRMMMERIS